MTTVHHASQRTSPPHVKKTALRAQRPAPLLGTFSSPKLGSKGIKSHKVGVEEDVGDHEDNNMATSFLQFCAMCEKQIIVPNNSILYCSENCRRKDGCKLPSENPYVTVYNDNGPLHSPELDEPYGIKARDVVPRRQPTARPVISSRIPPVIHTGKSDLDPTEWKPKLEHHPTSDAFQYLSQFHRSTSSLTTSRRSALLSCGSHPMRMANTAPSLSHTPTTSTTSSEGSLAGTPYEFVTRPLAPRHDAVMYSASASTKSIDLVLPTISACNSASVPSSTATIKKKSGIASPVFGDMTYEKKWVHGSGDTVGGSLKKLLYLQEVGDREGM
ncbi:hypothetical protein MMC24_006582 [Lignoscripta atroalba]|nr:hypothetical protein [Lignoscripta atroalba]